jgi:hypothetical protein
VNAISVTPGETLTVVVGVGGTGAQGASGAYANYKGGNGGGGAVRIIWGDNRAFPSTNTGNL